MNWEIKNMLVCPDSGTAYAVAASPGDLDIIVWYKGSYFLRPGNMLTTSDLGLFVNGRQRDIELISCFPYTNSLWLYFQVRTECPGNNNQLLTNCPCEARCLFPYCPYGVPHNTPCLVT
ncbi:hypothetical protein [Yokenella regensburgei]|jgi:hypothetical protein|uniref:Enhancing lycopene biosynthesis protein 1 n=1 Tax=Yokenella regensburgei TaxID=158877 RepID=A0AB38FTR1_9ENTR|nr:hypothetical protein [Yokenella regensburgei]KAF1367544.1 hypothetical protein FHR25_003970 [Yokenella regensburgei]QIU88984.1 anti-adapter protein iraM [Yokenella regensburgei]RKR64447.1 hypothetical protein C7387_1145 [Yokenella regensburgei]SQA61191.1 Enhancing lycopene biosynthesis protein 1 [Yokenella regensburgei]SQA66921.1 Enhancing lycopene biosynthesis protein 1 [Yokenella regensburgei]